MLEEADEVGDGDTEDADLECSCLRGEVSDFRNPTVGETRARCNRLFDRNAEFSCDSEDCPSSPVVRFMIAWEVCTLGKSGCWCA